MNCAEQQKSLALLASDDLDEDDVVAVRQHLLICAGCRYQLDEYRVGMEWVRRQRLNAGTANLSSELQRRLAGPLARRHPLPKSLAVFRRVMDQLSPMRHEHIVAGSVALLLLVGVAGAVQRPWSRWSEAAPDVNAATVSEGLSLTLARPDPAHLQDDHRVSSFGEDEETVSDDTVRDEIPAESEAGSAFASAEELFATTTEPGSLRIEMQTRDPDVRIIWFAQADGR